MSAPVRWNVVSLALGVMLWRRNRFYRDVPARRDESGA